MAVWTNEVLKVELVLVGFPLIDRPGELEAFMARNRTARISGSTVNVDVPSNVTEHGQQVTFDRERIILELLPSRPSIRREFPSDDSADLVRLAEVYDQVLSITSVRGKTLSAHGYNIDMVCEQNSGQSAHEYLGNKLFAGKTPDTEWQLIGGAGRMTYSQGGEQWQVVVEPRFGDTMTPLIYLTMNFHQNGPSLPTGEEVTPSLKSIRAQAEKFMQYLDGQP